MPQMIDEVNNRQHQRKPNTSSMIDSVVPQRREQQSIVTTRDNLTTCDSSWVKQSKSNSVRYEHSENWAATTVRGSPSDKDCRTAPWEPTASEPGASNDSLFHIDPPLVSDMPQMIDEVNNRQHQRKPNTSSMIDSVVPQRREQQSIVTTRDNLTTCDSSWVKQSKSNSVRYEHSENWAATTVRGSPSDKDCRTAPWEPTASEPGASNDSLFHIDQHVTGATVFAKCNSESKLSSTEPVQLPTSPKFVQSK
ncbi:hypothetical protein AHF37_07581 [Paragonimus kellicotti]|nr:hypothetical protein AHF37_07581 [Paragonimus kellicotti]